MDLNHGHAAYEAAALTGLSYAARKVACAPTLRFDFRVDIGRQQDVRDEGALVQQLNFLIASDGAAGYITTKKR